MESHPPPPDRAAPEPRIQPARDTHVSAADRILEAASRCIIDRGAAELSTQSVADEAGVSKGLIHYHFHDKEALLARLVVWVTDAVVRREEAALAGVTPATVVDTLWRWLAEEMERGELRVLVELAHARGARVRDATRASARERRATAAATIEHVFGSLGLRARIPPELLAGVTVAFIDGLAADAPLIAEADLRVAFDVFWLSLLSLAE